jgi:Putative S-adenosyl-L-methionine-dependent methyltransferase
MLWRSIRRGFCDAKYPLLTRDFIHDRLYHRTQGYFCK